MEVTHWDAATEGPFSEQAMREKLEALGFSVSRYVYAPGTVFPDHRHAVEKIDAVVSGRFAMGIAGKEVVLERGDCLKVPAGTVHRAAVVGDEPVVSLDATRG